MLSKRNLCLLGLILQTSAAFGLSPCTQETDCSSLEGSVCVEGDCVCPLGQQSVLGGTRCRDISPYYLSSCSEDHQCSNLVTGFECRLAASSEDGNCFCQTGFHYLRGRCWPTSDYGEPCNRDEECFGVIRDPFALACNVTCGCSEGYYQRQRGECRRIGAAVGDGCVINEDCQFVNGICDIATLRCISTNTLEDDSGENEEADTEGREDGEDQGQSSREGGVANEACNTTNVCSDTFVCSQLGVCICPAGYYASSDGGSCLAHLGSPSTAAQCVGLLAEVRNGICSCPANFFFEENMVDCIRATRRITDSCVLDVHCHTFGVNGRCGPPQEPWFLRSCECDLELSVWDASRDLCRLFAGIGEFCEVNSDCIAGNMEIECALNELGVGQCVCPSGYAEFEGLCLTTGLVLGDECQASQECTGTEHNSCINGRCSCDEGYQEYDGFCAPTIGGACAVDEDCTIENTVCVTENNSSTCRCGEGFVTYDDYCWPSVSGYNSSCNVTAQCGAAIRGASLCVDNRCVCSDDTHYRDSGCWNRIGLFETCARTSECFLQENASDRVVCRNSLCQCDFEYPYSEALHTCRSAASHIVSQISLIAITLFCIVIY